MNAPTVRCPACASQPRLLAVLGRMEHYRCDGCGVDFRRASPSPPPAWQPPDDRPGGVPEPLPEPLPRRARVRVAVREW